MKKQDDYLFSAFDGPHVRFYKMIIQGTLPNEHCLKMLKNVEFYLDWEIMRLHGGLDLLKTPVQFPNKEAKERFDLRRGTTAFHAHRKEKISKELISSLSDKTAAHSLLRRAIEQLEETLEEKTSYMRSQEDKGTKRTKAEEEHHIRLMKAIINSGENEQ